MSAITENLASVRELFTDAFATGGITAGVSLLTLFFNMAAALLLGVMIFITYKASHTGEVYSGRFNVSLVMLTQVTAIVMCAINNNVSLSLGLVGALSIVRFRTAIRDSRDTVFLFWAVAVGICCGVSQYMIAIMGSVFVFVFLMLFGVVRENERVLIVIRGTEAGLNSADRVITQHYSRHAVLRVNNLSISEGTGEAIYEIANNVKEKYDRHGGTVQSKLYGMEGLDSVSVVRQEEDISQ